ncbi:uncharacterized protein LOC143219588 [Lasioglossum baleicum]|uniref:uncharacterized protein LOC143219588 n=1 Tax=Lasioglossum baleicum TaxID=434251 RepID=UPI003FCCF56C
MYRIACSARRPYGEELTVAEDEEFEERRRQARMDTLDRWRRQLIAASSGRPVVRTILPIFDEWCRMRLRLTFRLTQVLSGHGCFGEYLHRMGREPTAQCHHCDAEVDTARHTLEECPAWAGPRRALCFAVEGWDLSLPVVFDRMIESERSWRAVTSFCEEVMSRKEVAERVREADPNSARRSCEIAKRAEATSRAQRVDATKRSRTVVERHSQLSKPHND